MPCDYLKRSGAKCDAAAYKGGTRCQQHVGAIPYIRCSGDDCEKMVSTKHGRPFCSTCERARTSKAKPLPKKAEGGASAPAPAPSINPNVILGLAPFPKEDKKVAMLSLAKPRAKPEPPKEAPKEAPEEPAPEQDEAEGDEPAEEKEEGAYEMLYAVAELPCGICVYQLFLAVNDEGDVEGCTCEKVSCTKL